MIPTSILILFFVFFIIWNNIPDLVEKVGLFLVAHAKCIRSREAKFEELKVKAAEVL